MTCGGRQPSGAKASFPEANRPCLPVHGPRIRFRTGKMSLDQLPFKKGFQIIVYIIIRNTNILRVTLIVSRLTYKKQVAPEFSQINPKFNWFHSTK